MAVNGYQSVLYSSTADGPAKTATAIATLITTTTTPLWTLPPNYFNVIGKKLRISMWGRISCAVTTPGTFRLDVLLGGTSVWNTGALNLNVVAKTNVPWALDIDFVCRSIGSGTSATLFGMGEFRSEAVVGAPLPSAGSNGSLLCPVGAPAVGSGFDSSASKTVDLHHTQTVSTGSVTLHHYTIEDPN
jgi:hypothetical protein